MERLKLAFNRRCNVVYVTLGALILGVLCVLSGPQKWFPKYTPRSLEKALVKAPLTSQRENPTENIKNLGEKERESKYNDGWSIPDDPGFIDYIKRKWIHYPSGVKSTRPGKDYSQLGEHRVVDDLLKQRSNGIFFEVGALDGITYSNTLGLEIIRNWTGILVEPDPASFAKLLRLKRNAYAINACLTTNKSEIRDFIPAAGIGSLVETNRDKPYVLHLLCISSYLPLVPHICVSELGHHWFRYWLVAYSAPSHYLNQCWRIVHWTPGDKFL